MRWTTAVHELEQFVKVDPGVSSQLCSGLTLEPRNPKPGFAPRHVRGRRGVGLPVERVVFHALYAPSRPNFLPRVIDVMSRDFIGVVESFAVPTRLRWAWVVPSVVEFATGRVKSSVNAKLADVPLRTVLQERLGLPVFVDTRRAGAAPCSTCS